MLELLKTSFGDKHSGSADLHKTIFRMTLRSHETEEAESTDAGSVVMESVDWIHWRQVNDSLI